MVNYDSDSSDGGDQDYTETNVLLGYASKEASESDDVNSYIGGQPVSHPLPSHLHLHIPFLYGCPS